MTGRNQNSPPNDRLLDLTRPPRSGRGAPRPGEPLSTRETEILALIALGWGNKEIAHRIGTSLQTVKNHVCSILAKLDVENRTQAAIWHYQHFGQPTHVPRPDESVVVVL